MAKRSQFIKGEFTESSLFVPKSYVFRGIDCLGRWVWITRTKCRVIRIYASYSPIRKLFYDVVKFYY